MPGERTEERTGEEWGPYTAYVEVLHPAILEALERGVREYGTAWKEHLKANAFEDAEHTINTHAKTRLAEAIQCLDYGDAAGCLAKLASACGYVANLVHKLRHRGLLA